MKMSFTPLPYRISRSSPSSKRKGFNRRNDKEKSMGEERHSQGRVAGNNRLKLWPAKGFSRLISLSGSFLSHITQDLSLLIKSCLLWRCHISWPSHLFHCQSVSFSCIHIDSSALQVSVFTLFATPLRPKTPTVAWCEMQPGTKGNLKPWPDSSFS